MRGSARAPCPGSGSNSMSSDTAKMASCSKPRSTKVLCPVRPCPTSMSSHTPNHQKWHHARSSGRGRSLLPYVRVPPRSELSSPCRGCWGSEGLPKDGRERELGIERKLQKQHVCVDRHCTCFPVHAVAKTELPLQDSPRFWMLQI